MEGLFPDMVPNFITFAHTVLGAAVNSTGRQRKIKKNLFNIQ